MKVQFWKPFRIFVDYPPVLCSALHYAHEFRSAERAFAKSRPYLGLEVSLCWPSVLIVRAVAVAELGAPEG
jgi:hypothetical protein